MDASPFDRLTRWLGGRTSRRTAVGTTLAGLALGVLDQLASAQDASPSPKASPAADGEKPVFMFVETFASGRGEANPAAGTPEVQGTPTPGEGASFLLTLEGHTGLTVYFSDRPDRVVGAVPTADFLENLGFDADNPPNAALVAEFQAGQGVVVMELVSPTYDASTGTLTYGAELLDAYKGGNLEPVTREQIAERLPAGFGPSALFIDDCPDVTRCKRNDPVDSFFKEYEVHDVGPIPGGPYGKCWSWSGLTCNPCHYTWDQLDAFCNDGYPDQCADGTCYAK